MRERTQTSHSPPSDFKTSVGVFSGKMQHSKCPQNFQVVNNVEDNSRGPNNVLRGFSCSGSHCIPFL